MGAPDVSVIMAAYNGERYIEESIRSVLAQTHAALELIVIDDGSTDGTWEVVNALRAADERVVYAFQPNGRQGKARNNGIRRARGALIAFCDQDDLWVPDKLARQLAALAAHPTASASSSATATSSTTTTSPTSARPSRPWPANGTATRCSGSCSPRTASRCSRRWCAGTPSCASACSARTPLIQNCDDWDLWLRLAADGCRFLGMPERLVRYRLHSQQASRDPLVMGKAEITVLEQFRDSPLLPADTAARDLERRYSRLVDGLIAAGRLDEAARMGDALAARRAVVGPAVARGRLPRPPEQLRRARPRAAAHRLAARRSHRPRRRLPAAQARSHMSAPPLVSVIVPSYNYGHFLAHTLASVQAQTHRRWECIVVDDGSTDDTWQVAFARAHADERIRYVRRCNGGLSAARNTGVAAARGDYVQFLDADDALEPRKLEAQVDFLERQPDVGLVYGDVRYFDSDTGARRRGLFVDETWMPEVSGDGERLLRALIRANIMVVSSPLLRRTVIDCIGAFDETLTSLEDWDYWLRCAAAGVYFQYLDAPGTLALVRVHRRSMSQNRVTMQQQQARIRRALTPAILGDELHRINRFFLSEELGRLGAELVADHDPLQGVRYLGEAALAHPSTGGRWARQALRALLPF